MISAMSAAGEVSQMHREQQQYQAKTLAENNIGICEYQVHVKGGYKCMTEEQYTQMLVENEQAVKQGQEGAGAIISIIIIFVALKMAIEVWLRNKQNDRS